MVVSTVWSRVAVRGGSGWSWGSASPAGGVLSHGGEDGRGRQGGSGGSGRRSECPVSGVRGGGGDVAGRGGEVGFVGGFEYFSSRCRWCGRCGSLRWRSPVVPGRWCSIRAGRDRQSQQGLGAGRANEQGSRGSVGLTRGRSRANKGGQQELVGASAGRPRRSARLARCPEVPGSVRGVRRRVCSWVCGAQHQGNPERAPSGSGSAGDISGDISGDITSGGRVVPVAGGGHTGGFLCPCGAWGQDGERVREGGTPVLPARSRS